MWRHALLISGMLAAIGLAATAQRFVSPTRAYSLDETERLVKQDVASMVNGSVSEVRIAERAERQLPGADLCGTRSAQQGDAVDGYAFTAKHGQGHFEYRTDRQGNLRRCVIVRPIN